MSCDAEGRTVQASLSARTHLSQLSRLSEFVAAFFTQNGLSAEVAADFELALEELFVNIVRYGHPKGGEHEATVGLKLEGDTICLVLEDDGIPFNPLEAPLLDLNLPLAERGVGGLGIHLVKGVMDDFQYTRAANRNRLEIRKRIRS